MSRPALVLAIAAATSACAATQRPAARPPRITVEEPSTFSLPELSGDWLAPEVERGRPLPLPGGRAALLLLRRAGDHREVALAIGRGPGEAAAIVPVARVDLAGSRREVLSALSTFIFGDERLLRVDVRVFELAAPHFFAVKTQLVTIDGRRVLDRLSESGNDVRDRRARLSARDLDGDGASELLIEERESGDPRPRRLVYHRGPGGVFATQDPSLFAE